MERRTDKRGEGWGRGETRDSDVPSRRISPLTAVIQMGVPFALASKTGGEGEVFFFFCITRASRVCSGRRLGVEACAWVHLDGEATRRAMISWQVHLYGEAARFFFSLMEQVHHYYLGFLCGWFHGLVSMFLFHFCLMYFINL